jgi:protein involved in polysaccharide export with SLBB domain
MFTVAIMVRAVAQNRAGSNSFFPALIRRARVSLLSCLALAAPLASGEPPAAVSTNAAVDANLKRGALTANHKLAPHDTLSFRIVEDQIDLRESNEPKTLTVTESGDLEVPYIGFFPVAGKTPQEAAAEIKRELEKKYYYTATIVMSVDLTTKTRGSCYVSGQVKFTGAVDLPGEETLTVSKAVVRAGGFTDYADKRHVRLTRHTEEGKRTSKTITVDLTKVIERGKTDADLAVEPGDSIFVPSRLLSF